MNTKSLPSMVGLCGSLRVNSFNKSLLNICKSELNDRAYFAHLQFDDFPLYREDRCEDGFPISVLQLGERILSSDAVVISTPEYNFSILGGLKNALDWLSRLPSQPFKNKPVAILGASTGKLGSARAQYHLRQVLQCLEARVVSKPEVFVAYATSAMKDGKLADANSLEAIRLLMGKLMESVDTGSVIAHVANQ